MAYSISFLYEIIDKYSKKAFSMASATTFLKKSLERGQQDLKRLQAGFSRFTTIGFAAAIGGAAMLIKKSTSLFDIQTTAVKNVQAGLESTGGVAGRTLKQLTDQASTLQKNTFFGDETILQNVTAQMLTFTNITESSFDRAQKAALDVTAKLHGLEASGEATKSVSIMLGKALNDPVANLGALSRSGIQFSKQQKEVIKTLAESGRLSEAQAMILSELEKQYGGTANALAMTTAGQRKSIQNQIGDIQELIGSAIEPLRMEWQKLLLNILPKITEKVKLFSKYIKENKEVIIGNVKKSAQIFINFIKALKPFGPIILGIIAAFKVYRIIMLGVAAVQALVAATNPVTLIIIGVGILIGLVYKLYKNWDLVSQKLADAWNKAKPWISIFSPGLAAIVEIVKAFYDNWEAIKMSFQEGGIKQGLFAIGKAMISGLLAPLQTILETAAKIPGIGIWAQKGAEGIAKFRESLFSDENAELRKRELKKEVDDMNKAVKKTKDQIQTPIDISRLTQTQTDKMTGILNIKRAQFEAQERAAYTEKYVRAPGPSLNAPDTKTNVNATMDLRVYNETDSKIVPMRSNSDLGYNEVGK